MSTMFDQIGATLNNDIVKPVGGFLNSIYQGSNAQKIANSPGAKQLGNELGGFFNKPEAVQGSNGVYQSPTNTTPGLIKPTTPVASHTVTNTDGSTVKQTYQPNASSTSTAKTLGDNTGGSTPLAPDDPSNKYNTATGQLNPNYNGGTSSGVLPIDGSTTGATTATPTTSTPPPTVFSQAQTGLLNRANGQESPQVTAARQALEDTQNKEAGMLSQIGGAGSPQTSGSAAGSAMTDQSLMNSQIGNEQQALTSALTSQGQQITAGQSVQSPMGNTAYALDPTTGQIIQSGGSGGSTPTFPGATGNSLIDNTVQQALNQVAAGGDPTNNPGFDAVKALNSPQAVNAYNEGVTAIKNGSYNPTTSSAIAQSTASQKGSFAQQSQQLDVTLKTLSGIGNTLQSFMSSTGLNPDTSSFLNQMQNTTIGSLKNPGNIATYNELVNGVQTYATAIYQAAGMTPTDAGNLAKGISIDGMTGNSLNSFLNNLDTIGQQKKSQLDAAANGSSASTSATPLQTTPDSSQYNIGNTRTQQGIGAGINFGTEMAVAGTAIWKAISSIF